MGNMSKNGLLKTDPESGKVWDKQNAIQGFKIMEIPNCRNYFSGRNFEHRSRDQTCKSLLYERRSKSIRHNCIGIFYGTKTRLKWTPRRILRSRTIW